MKLRFLRTPMTLLETEMVMSLSGKTAKGFRQSWLTRYNMVLAYARQLLHNRDTLFSIF